MNWKKLNEQLPPKNTLVLVKRITNKSEIEPLYLAKRQDKNLSFNSDMSRECYWYGTSLNDINEENESVFEFNFLSSFNDQTVSEWCFINECF